MNTNRWVFLTMGLLVAVLLGFIVYVQRSIPKIGYVKTGVLVEKYKGMADASKELEKKMEKWQANVDTLQMNYQKSVDGYNSKYSRLSTKERTELKSMLDRQERAISEYVQNIEKQASEENVKLTKGVLAQLNTYIKKYAEQQKFDMIYGLTTEGNILYGKEALDITERILTGANNEYTGK